MLPGGDRANSAPAPLEDNFFDASVGRLSTVTAAAMNCRNSTKLRRYDNTDSAPLFSLARVGGRASEQPPVTGSISVVCRSFLPRNQSNARLASSDHSSPLLTPYAAIHAEIVAHASTGCGSNALGNCRILPKLAEPTGLKQPDDVV